MSGVVLVVTEFRFKFVASGLAMPSAAQLATASGTVTVSRLAVGLARVLATVVG